VPWGPVGDRVVASRVVEPAHRAGERCLAEVGQRDGIDGLVRVAGQDERRTVFRADGDEHDRSRAGRESELGCARRAQEILEPGQGADLPGQPLPVGVGGLPPDPGLPRGVEVLIRSQRCGMVRDIELGAQPDELVGERGMGLAEAVLAGVGVQRAGHENPAGLLQQFHCPFGLACVNRC
jgi:hypothetical protein